MREEPMMKILLNTLPQQGMVTWIGIRPVRRAPIQPVQQVELKLGTGLVGDHHSGVSTSKRQVTIIQYEHLESIASMLGKGAIYPQDLRRNIVVKGINLLALKDKRFRIGKVLLEMTGLCHPCSRMEENLGHGGYNAVRGHGGITAKVLEGGIIHLNDKVWVEV